MEVEMTATKPPMLALVCDHRFAKLPANGRRRLLSCPPSGNGVHAWLYPTACILHDCNLHPDEIEELLDLASGNCGRLVEGHEISDAVLNSSPARRDRRPSPSGTAGKKSAPLAKMPRWTTKNYNLIENIARAGKGLRGVSDPGPPVTETPRQTDAIVSCLFPGDPLICCGADTNQFSTRYVNEWCPGLWRLPFIVPNPMTAPTGKTKNGTVSTRCLDNTGARRFQVVEFDFKVQNKDDSDTPDSALLRSLAADGITVADLNVSLHCHLAQFQPLVLIVHSGGRSEHGWYFVEPQAEEKVFRFMQYAVSLGADHATFTKCQLVRMPDGTRYPTGERQLVRYFNPEEIK